MTRENGCHERSTVGQPNHSVCLPNTKSDLSVKGEKKKKNHSIPRSCISGFVTVGFYYNIQHDSPPITAGIGGDPSRTQNKSKLG